MKATRFVQLADKARLEIAKRDYVPLPTSPEFLKDVRKALMRLVKKIGDEELLLDIKNKEINLDKLRVVTDKNSRSTVLVGHIIIPFKEDAMYCVEILWDAVTANDDYSKECTFKSHGEEWFIGDGDDSGAATIYKDVISLWIRSWPAGSND